jgi:hypothetical protein
MNNQSINSNPLTMKRTSLTTFIVAALVLLSAWWLWAQSPTAAPEKETSNSRLAVLWTSGDPEVAHRACLMYVHAAHKQKWFDEVVLVVWGPSARLLAADKDVQAKIKSMMRDGVKVQACVACADSYGVSARLRELGMEVKGMGAPLTEMLKQGWKVLTY